MEPVLETVRPFWGDALDLERIRFVDSRCARLTGRAFVLHDRIHWPGPAPTSPSPAVMATVVHELAHCWQHQTGRWQIARGVIEQLLYTLLGWWLVALGGSPLYDPYDYGGAPGLAGTRSLDDLRFEAQARVIEHHWLATAEGSRSIGPEPLRDEQSRPTALARDLQRLCRAAGLP